MREDPPRALNPARFAAVIAFAAAACATVRRDVVRAPTLQSLGDNEITRDGLRIELTPVTYENVRQYPQIYRRFQVGGAVVERPVVPLPAFRARVSNNTGHVLRFTGAIFRAQDESGHSYPPYVDRAELQSWASTSLSGDPRTSEMQTLLLANSAARAAVETAPLLTRGVELLNGDEWSGFLVFNWGHVSQNDAIIFMASTERILVRLAEVPTELNEAGVVSRTAEFQYRFGRGSYPQEVTCRGGAAASVLTCAWEPPTRRVSYVSAPSTDAPSVSSPVLVGRSDPSVAGGDQCHAARIPADLREVVDEESNAFLPRSDGGQVADGTYLLVRYIWYGEGRRPENTRRTAFTLQGNRLQMAFSRNGGGATHLLARAVFAPTGNVSIQAHCPREMTLEFDRFASVGDDLVLVSTRDRKAAYFRRVP